MEPIAWTEESRALWARIAAHDFEPAGAALTFAGRFARDHGWSLAEARAVIDDYRRFCFLAVVTEGEVTPSEEVDEVWHQHLTDSRDYWQVWCRTALGRDLHHGPTLGGPAERRRFARQYAETLAAYEAWFGPPPAEVWPGTAQRFDRRPRFRLIDRRRRVVVSLPRDGIDAVRRVSMISGLVAALVLAPLRPAAAVSLGILDWTAGPFLTLYAGLVAVSLLAAYGLPLRLASLPPGTLRRTRLDPVELAWLAGGRARAADVLNLEAMAAGDLTVAGTKLVVGGEEMSRPARTRQLAGRLDAAWTAMAADGLAVSVDRLRRMQGATLASVLPVLIVGAAKVVVGQARGKPVGYLVLAMATTAILVFVLAARRRPGSRAGYQALASYRRENARALRAPRPDEILAAFACLGAAALVGTDFEPYAALLTSKGDGGGCGGGGDGGGGGGGSGCGGCGGGGD